MGGANQSALECLPPSLPQLLCLIWESAGVCRVTTVRLAALLLPAGVLFASAFGERADADVGRPDETSVATAAASLHRLPVASMPPSVPPEQSWAWAERVKSVPATSEIRNFAFMRALRSSWSGGLPVRSTQRARHDSTMPRRPRRVESDIPDRTGRIFTLAKCSGVMDFGAPLNGCV
jgi:hypothetical protein